MKKKCVMLATVLAVLAAGTGCTENDMDEIAYVPPEAERYENHIEIEGQWGASAATGEDGQYGIGDPFVMRWNGKYYLYPSTSDPCDGIKVFESDDLIHWTYRGMAGAVLSSIPMFVIYISFQKYFIESLSISGVKG